MAKTIRNINDRWGMPVTFEAPTVEEAVANIGAMIQSCGPELEGPLREGIDYEIVDDKTNVQSVRDIIRAFLSLPHEAMPSASYVDMDEAGDAWSDIREYMLDSGVAPGVEIRLHADRPEWQSVTVSLDTE